MNSIKRTALSALLSALSVAVMYIGSMFGKMDMATAVVSSLCVMIALGEYGYKSAFGVYLVTAVLSFVIVPVKTAVILFVVLFGLYPLVKLFSASRGNKVAEYVIKYCYLNVSLVVLVVITVVFFVKLPVWVVALIFAGANLLLPVYDFALNGLMAFYCNRIRRG